MKKRYFVLAGVLAVILLCGCSAVKEPGAVDATQAVVSQTTVPTVQSLPPETQPTPTETESPETIPEETQGIKKEFDQVPLYHQNDYADVPFDNGSVATKGCGITSLSMVASYIRGEEITPDLLAPRIDSYDATNLDRLEAATVLLELSSRVTYYWEEVIYALRQGKLVIVLVNDQSDFTTLQHFLVLTGLTKDGKILVNDANAVNYGKSALAGGYYNGFDPEMIHVGFDGGWIYENTLFSPPEESRYDGITLTEVERELLAKAVWLESRYETVKGQQAMAEVFLNRMLSRNYPDTMEEIILSDERFSREGVLDSAQPDELAFKIVERALSGPEILPENVIDFSDKNKGPNVWGRIERHVYRCEEN